MNYISYLIFSVALPGALIGFIIGSMIFGSEAQGDTLYTGAVSTHIDEGASCETHPLLAYERNGYIGGVLRNSYCDWSAFAGHRWAASLHDNVEVGATLGAVYGYENLPGVDKFAPMGMLDVRVSIDWARPTVFMLGKALAFSPGWRVDW